MFRTCSELVLVMVVMVLSVSFCVLVFGALATESTAYGLFVVADSFVGTVASEAFTEICAVAELPSVVTDLCMSIGSPDDVSWISSTVSPFTTDVMCTSVLLVPERMFVPVVTTELLLSL